MLAKAVGVIHGRFQTSRANGALTPMLRLCAVVCPVFVTASYYFAQGAETRSFAILAFAMAMAPVIVSCAAFIVFGILDSSKLQSEQYQLKHEALGIIRTNTPTVEEIARIVVES